MSTLKPSPKNLRYFQNEEGQPLYFCGVDGSPLLYRAGVDVRRALRQLAESGVNVFHLKLETLDRDPVGWVHPFKRIRGNARTPQGFRKFDLTQLNPAFFEQLTALVRLAEEMRLFVQVGLLPEDEEFIGDSWPLSAWNSVNQAQGEHYPVIGFTEGRLSPLSEENPDDPFQERLAALSEAVLEATVDFENMFYALPGCDASSPKGLQHWLNRVTSHTDGPILVDAKQRKHVNPAQIAGFIAFEQEMEANPRLYTQILARHLMAAPHTAESLAALRDRVWTAFLNGEQLFLDSAFQEDAPGGNYWDSQSMVELTAIRRFLRARQVRYWTMQPHPDLTEGGAPCLARPGDRYLLYSSVGSEVALNLTEDSATYILGWWNVQEETFVTQGTVRGGGTPVWLPPEGGPWVLDLCRKAVQSSPTFSSRHQVVPGPHDVA